MKILDRYVVFSFMRNYLISLFVLIGMYVTLDMVFNFDELVQVQERAGTTGVESALVIIRAALDFYFYQMFYIFVQLSGMIPVVAVAFTLLRLSRFNELSAILSAGVPLLRVAAPIIIVALILNALLLLDQELLIPEIIPKLVRSRQEAGQATTSGAFHIAAMQDDRHGVLNAARYRPGPGEPVMYEVTLIERDENQQLKSRVIASKATWDSASKSWALENGRRIGGMAPNTPRAVEDNVARYQSNITPEEINLYRSGNYVDLLSTRRIDELLARPQSYGTLALLRVKHSRFTQPLINVIMLLLAIPCVLTRAPGQLKLAATKCLILTGACMVTSFLSQQLAGYPMVPGLAAQWPAMMAWAPILLFGPVAVFLLDRIET